MCWPQAALPGPFARLRALAATELRPRLRHLAGNLAQTAGRLRTLKPPNMGHALSALRNRVREPGLKALETARYLKLRLAEMDAAAAAGLRRRFMRGRPLEAAEGQADSCRDTRPLLVIDTDTAGE